MKLSKGIKINMGSRVILSLMNIVLLLVVLTPLFATFFSMMYMPDVVILHYGPSGPDDFGAKTELFVAAGIMSFSMFICWLCFVFCERITALQPWKNQSEKSIFMTRIILAGSIILLAVLYVVILLLIYLDSSAL